MFDNVYMRNGIYTRSDDVIGFTCFTVLW